MARETSSGGTRSGREKPEGCPPACSCRGHHEAGLLLPESLAQGSSASTRPLQGMRFPQRPWPRLRATLRWVTSPQHRLPSLPRRALWRIQSPYFQKWRPWRASWVYAHLGNCPSLTPQRSHSLYHFFFCMFWIWLGNFILNKVSNWYILAKIANKIDSTHKQHVFKFWFQDLTAKWLEARYFTYLCFKLLIYKLWITKDTNNTMFIED